MTPTAADVARLAAFTEDPSGGNPAGVLLADDLPPPGDMQRVAAEVGYSETAFLAPTGDRRFEVRYFAPAGEVTFCGHATIAAGVLLGDRIGPGSYRFDTAAGEVAVDVERTDGRLRAALTSVPPRHRGIDPEDLDIALDLFGWTASDLDPSIPPAEAYAGAWHLVLALRDRGTLAGLSYDFEALRDWMAARDLTTVQIVHRRDPLVFDARDPFPVGGVVEDPATGAAAAALGGYLRDIGAIAAPTTLTVRQGEDLGRPSLLIVDVPTEGGIRVSGTAVELPA